MHPRVVGVSRLLQMRSSNAHICISSNIHEPFKNLDQYLAVRRVNIAMVRLLVALVSSTLNFPHSTSPMVMITYREYCAELMRSIHSLFPILSGYQPNRRTSKPPLDA